MITTEQSPSVLRELIERFQICWEVWPEYVMVRGERRQIGFVLELSGTFEPAPDYPYPDWVARQRVYAALRRIAEAILPQEKRPSGYKINPYDQAYHYSRRRGNRPDVTVAVRILHRQGFDRPVDACEVRCLEEMKQHLRDLGADEAQWTARREPKP